MTNATPADIANIGIAIKIKKKVHTIPYMPPPPDFVYKNSTLKVGADVYV